MAMADQTSNMVGEEQVGDFRRKKWIEAIATQSNYHFGLPYQVKYEEKIKCKGLMGGGIDLILAMD
jgi:hypothetical protein